MLMSTLGPPCPFGRWTGTEEGGEPCAARSPDVQRGYEDCGSLVGGVLPLQAQGRREYRYAIRVQIRGTEARWHKRGTMSNVLGTPHCVSIPAWRRSCLHHYRSVGHAPARVHPF